MGVARAHLVKRFVGSLRPGGPPAADEAWVRRPAPAERSATCGARMSGPDRRHAVGVARRVERSLGHEATRPVLAAALLHDVGKIESGLGTYGRVVATLSAKVAGPDMATQPGVASVASPAGSASTSTTTASGGDLLELAGSDPLTAAWAREHHRPEDEWTVDPRHRRRPQGRRRRLSRSLRASLRSSLRSAGDWRSPGRPQLRGALGRSAVLGDWRQSPRLLAEADGSLGSLEGDGGGRPGPVGALGEQLA